MPSVQVLAVALITFYAVVTDLKFNKIPNTLVLSGLVGGLLLQIAYLGPLVVFKLVHWFFYRRASTFAVLRYGWNGSRRR